MKQKKISYNDYKAFGRGLVEDVLRYAREDVSGLLNGTSDKSSSPYKLIKKGEVRVFERIVPGTGINMIRAEMTVNTTATNLLSWMCEPSFLQYLDSSFLEPKANLHAFDANHEITYYKYGSSGPIAKRDFVTFEVNNKEAEGFYVTAACTVDFPKKPPVKDLVRAEIWTSGYVLKDTGDGKCYVIYIVHGSPKGYIPNALVNLAQTRQPFMSMCRIRERYLRATPGPSASSAVVPEKEQEESSAEEEVKDDGSTFTRIFEDLMKHPQIMEKIMNLEVVKRLLKEPETFKGVIKKFTGGDDETAESKAKAINPLELFDPQQFHEMLDLIVTESLSLDELNDFLKEFLGLDCTSDEQNGRHAIVGKLSGAGVAQLRSLQKQKQIVKAVDNSDEGRREVLHFKVFSESHILKEYEAADDDLHQKDVDDSKQEITEKENLAYPATSQQINILNNLAITGAPNVEQWSASFKLSTSAMLEIQQREVERAKSLKDSGDKLGNSTGGGDDVRTLVDQLRLAWREAIAQQPALRVLLLKQTKKKGEADFSSEEQQHPLQQQSSSPASTPRSATTVHSASSQWWQVLPAKNARPQWSVYDWIEEANPQADWLEFLEEDRTDEFDAQRFDSLIRFSVCLLPEEVRLVWSFHPALLDSSSVTQIASMVLKRMDDINSHQNSSLPPSVQSTLLQVKRRLVHTERNNQLEFWKRYLSDFKAPTPLFLCKPMRNIDLKRRKSAPAKVGRIHLSMSEKALAQLVDKSAHHGIAIETVILSAWSFLLSRCSGGEKKVLFGLCGLAKEETTTDNNAIGCNQPIVPVLVDLEISENDLSNSAEKEHLPHHHTNKHGLQPLPLWDFLKKLANRIQRIQELTNGKECLALDEIQKQSEVPEEYRLVNSLLVLHQGGYKNGFQSGAVQDFEPRWNYPLVLDARMGNKVSFTLRYDTTHFSENSANRLANYFQTLLEGITAAGEEQDAHQLPMLPYEEQHELTIGVHDNYAPYPKTVRVEYLFEEQVKKTPERVAIEFEGKEYTYKQLDEQANQMAHYFRSRGIHGDGCVVGLYMVRSVHMVVAMMALVKAGAAYLPLDPRTPRERVHVILDDAKAKGVVTNQDKAEYLFEEVPEHQRPVILCVDKKEDLEALAAQPTAPFEESFKSTLHCEGLMYIIYTSGSTGKPKGVKICHRSLINQFYYIAKLPGMTENDKILGVSTISFDIAQLELMLPITIGARILLVTAEVARDGLTLKSVLESNSSKNCPEHPLTIVQATPATWRMLCAAGWDGDKETLSLWCGGEAMTCDLAKQLLPRCVGLYNMYGPTETTVWGSVLKVLPEHVGPHSTTIPVGGPVDNSQFFVLDQHRQLVPKGVLGELYIAGDGVGSYVDKELSDKAYVQNTFKSWFAEGKTSDRMFRVGDVLRYKNDSSDEEEEYSEKVREDREKEEGTHRKQKRAELEFLGRVDHQVKIRGYRIELEEIVNHLYTHENVGECLVVAKQPAYEGGEKYLVAYVIMKKKKNENENEKEEEENEREKETELGEKEKEKLKRTLAHNLRIMLEEKLPPYMVPSYFMVLDKWPLSPNGKIDRNALPVPTRSSHEQTYVAPKNETERKLVQAFEEVLQLSPIGIEDDFFELGGNSLLGVSLIGSIEAKFGIQFPFSVIFSASSIHLLAQCIEEAIKTRATAGASTSASTQQHAAPAHVADSCATATVNPDKLLSSLDSPVVPLQTKGDKIPLFFVHPAFKSSVCYGALSFYLGDDQPFYGLEPRVEYESIESMAASYAQAILQVQPQGPYRIGGWSFGCLVAYEICRQLEALGHKVDKLIMLDGRAPLYQDEGDIDLDALVMCILCRGAKQFLGFGMDISYKEIRPMTPDKRLLHVVEKVLDQNGLEKISPGVAGSFFFRFQRDIKESEVWVRKYALPAGGKKFGGTIHLFRSINTKPFIDFEDKILETSTLGWEHFSDQPIDVIETNSDHESIVFQPAVREVAHKVRKCLEGDGL